MGADPRHKDIFVQLDWMETGPNRLVLKPNARMLKMVIDSFNAAPVDNPDGKKGVHLHVDAGPDSIMNPVTGQKWGPRSQATAFQFQQTLGSLDGDSYDWSDFDTRKQQSFFTLSKRDAVFRYGLF